MTEPITKYVLQLRDHENEVWVDHYCSFIKDTIFDLFVSCVNESPNAAHRMISRVDTVMFVSQPSVETSEPNKPATTG